MAEARDIGEYNRSAPAAWFTYQNWLAQFDKKNRPRKPLTFEDFHPYAKKPKSKAAEMVDQKLAKEMMRAVFSRKKK